ncbi:ABC transporter substrate-binding protein [Glycomyces arizonensis]|uniref:ABC transporter substrate-binding protein n=1 Tax=Glycomyces arizonensis TaxID=256035 RepID=UPI0004222454|nr:ABC transporter substrate-binding protein [Glycomyces arizonensis]
MTLSRRAFGGLTISGSAALALSACGGNEGDSGGGDEELSWAIAYPWEAWNLNTTTGNNSSGKMALTPMTPIGQVGYDFGPDADVFYDDALFDAAPELVAEAPMQIKLHLKEGAQWSDGKPVRLEDFIFQWHSMSGNPEHANQEKALPASTDWGSNITAIEQAEDGTVLVTFADGYVDPEWAFNGGVYLPSHFAEENGFENWASDPEVMGDAVKWFNENLHNVVTGPYVPVDSKLGEYVKYEVNENYQGSVKPTVKKLTCKVVTGIEAEVTELRQGTIAGCWPNDFSLDELAKTEEDPALTYETYAGSTWSHLDFNVRGKFTADTALREAVFTAIDIADIKEKAFPGTEVPWKGNHFFSEGSPYYVDYLGETTQGSGDADAARQILTDAGYTWNGDDKLMSPEGEQVVFNFRFASSNAIRKLTGELIQSHVVGIGIDLELKGFADDEFAAVLDSHEFDMIVFSWVGNAAFTTGPQQFFRSDSGSNYGGLDNADIDAAVDLVRSTLDLDQAAEYANQVGRLATAEAFNLPLYDSPLSIMWNTEMLSGPSVNAYSQAGPMYNVREWSRP